jgi:hypothetical protein
MFGSSTSGSQQQQQQQPQHNLPPSWADDDNVSPRPPSYAIATSVPGASGNTAPNGFPPVGRFNRHGSGSSAAPPQTGVPLTMDDDDEDEEMIF